MPTIGLRSDHPPDQIPVSHHDQREQTYWAERVEPLLGDDVEVRGECDQEQKADLLSRAVALLFPIRWPSPSGW